MKILVIGSEGYIGGRLFPYLLNRGYNVIGIDSGYYGNLDLRFDYNSYVRLGSYDIIILLAGHSSPTLCENDIEGSFKNNVVNFKNLLGKLNGNQRLLYASSASVCNGLKNAKEETPLNNPISNYDMQKQIIEKIALMSNVTTIGMRFGTIGGYSPNGRLDSILNSVYHDAVNKGTITVSNEDNFRSYLGMKDALAAVEALIHIPKPEKIYNIASGTLSINDIAQTIGKLTGVEVVKNGGDNNYSFWMNTDRINTVVQMRDTIQSICADMGNMVNLDKNIHNRNTNLFKY